MPTRRAPEPTKKQRYWLDHLVACGKSGRRLSEYAAIHGLNLQRFYSWKTFLKSRGLLPTGSSRPTVRLHRSDSVRRSDRGGGQAPARFAAVHVPGGGGDGPSPALRVRFPNGITVETTGSVAASLDRDLLSYLAGLP